MTSLAERPTVGKLVVPFMVDATRDPIDFKAVDAEHVRQCAKQHRCGICGGRIKTGPYAFIGPDDGRRCFADPGMHLKCARLAMAQCPFLGARRDWRDEDSRSNPLLQPYAHNMTLFVATGGQSPHRPARALALRGSGRAVEAMTLQPVNPWHGRLAPGTRPDRSGGFGSRRGRPAMSTGDARFCTSAERCRSIPASTRLPEQPSSVGAALRVVRVAFLALWSAYTEYTAVSLAGLAFTCVARAWRGIIMATKTLEG